MSRGHGTAQRLVLEHLASLASDDPAWVRIRRLARARRTDGGDPTRAELETIARAARRLAAAGLVERAWFIPTPDDPTRGKLSHEPGKGEPIIRAAKGWSAISVSTPT